MTTSQILELDCRIEKNKEIIQKVLRQIKPLAKCPEGQQIPLEKLERCLEVMCKKYNVYVSSMYPDMQAGDSCIVWRCCLSTRNTVYGCTLYECIAKAVILVFSKTRQK